MLQISKELIGDHLTVSIAGRLDINTVPELESQLDSSFDGVSKLTFDFSDLEYISSAGLRIILSARKKMKSDNAVVIKGASKEVRDIFEVTGFSSILDVGLL